MRRFCQQIKENIAAMPEPELLLDEMQQNNNERKTSMIKLMKYLEKISRLYCSDHWIADFCRLTVICLCQIIPLRLLT